MDIYIVYQYTFLTRSRYTSDSGDQYIRSSTTRTHKLQMMAQKLLPDFKLERNDYQNTKQDSFNTPNHDHGFCNDYSFSGSRVLCSNTLRNPSDDEVIGIVCTICFFWYRLLISAVSSNLYTKVGFCYIRRKSQEMRLPGLPKKQ